MQQEDKTIPSVNKYLWNSGYGEGWALYVERLSDEMNLYSDDVSRLGMLSNEALRTARLVVDTGMHVLGWNREQAVDYMSKHTTLSGELIGGEIDRYIIWPGQATSYMLGKFEIAKLRDLAQEQLGAHFNIRQFHNQVLKNGVVTLPMLRIQIERWVAEQKMLYLQEETSQPVSRARASRLVFFGTPGVIQEEQIAQNNMGFPI